MSTRPLSVSSIKTQFQRYITYILCFSLCVANPGFIHLALSQQPSPTNQSPVIQEENMPNETESLHNSPQDASGVDKNRLRDHPLYQEISHLDEEVTKQFQATCCEDVPGVVDSSNLEPLDAILQRYQQVKQSVEDYVNNQTTVHNIPTQYIKEYCFNQESYPQECRPLILYLLQTYGSNIFLEYLTEYCFNQDTFPQECRLIIVNFIKKDTIADNIFIEYLKEHCLNQETQPEECLQVDRLRLFFINNNKTFIQDQLSDIFTQYLEHLEISCLNQETTSVECASLENLRSHFINNNKTLIENRLNDIFITYIDVYCTPQEVMPEECSTVASIRSSLNIINNVIFMGLILSIAHKLILTQMYLGTTLDEIDLSLFTLSVNRDAHIDGQQVDDCSENTDRLNDRIDGRLGLNFSMQTNTEYEEKEGQCYYNVEIDRSIFVGSQMAIEMSKDSDQALIQFLLYPILESYYESLRNIQVLKGVRHEDTKLPDISLLPQNTTFSIYDFTENIIFEETKTRFSTLSFGDALKEAFRMLINNSEQQQQIRLFTNDILKDILSTLDTTTTQSLRNRIYQEEFSSNFISKVESSIDEALGNIYEDYTQGKTNRLLLLFLSSKFDNIWTNVIATEEDRITLRTGIDPQVATKVRDTYFSIRNPLINNQEHPTRHLRLLENLENLIDQWVEKTSEIIEEKALTRHQEYIEEIIQEANRISLVNDNRLSTYAIYQVVKSQEDFSIHPTASAELDQTFFLLPSDSSYVDARNLFNGLLQQQLVGLTDDMSLIFVKDEEGTTSKIIDPNQVRKLLEKLSPTALQSRINRQANQQSTNAKKRHIEYLLVVGEDMGFFNTSLISEGQDEQEIVPFIRNIIFSQLGPLQRGFQSNHRGFWGNFWKPCYYTSLPSCTDAQEYLEIYKEHQKDDILNKHRILSDRYSPVAGKPLFEIIQDNCSPEMDKEICRSRVSNIMMGALERQEEDIQNNFQELIRDLTNEDTSEALRKVIFALEDNETGAFTNLRFILNTKYRALLDFHNERLQNHLQLTDSEKFIEYNINKPADDLMIPLGLLILPGIAGSISQALARGARVLGKTTKKQWLQTFASRQNRNQFIGLMFTTTFLGTTGRDIYRYYNDVEPKADFIKDLYYISPQENILVSHAQFIMSEELKDQVYFDTITIPVYLIGGLMGLYVGSAAFRFVMNVRLGTLVRSMPGHLEKLGIRLPNSAEWTSLKWTGKIDPWDMKALRGKVDILKRFIEPCSKLKLYSHWQQLFYPDFLEKDLKIDDIYRSLDILSHHKEDIEKSLYMQVSRLMLFLKKLNLFKKVGVLLIAFIDGKQNQLEV